LASSALRRQTLKVRARCGSAARRDLCGGRGEDPRPYRDQSIRIAEFGYAEKLRNEPQLFFKLERERTSDGTRSRVLRYPRHVNGQPKGF
jgi:hypothetical protein